MRALVPLLIAPLLLVACSTPVEVPCPAGPIFTHSIIDPDSILQVHPLGNVNPPGHTFPTDHQYIDILYDEGTQLTCRVNIYCPGDMTLVEARVAHRVHEGVTDFALILRPCERMEMLLGHVGEMDAELLGEHADWESWPLSEEYETGGEIFRVYSKRLDIPVAAGQKLGESGGVATQTGIDVNFYDFTRSAVPAANRDRWGEGGYLKAASFMEYMEEGPLLDSLLELFLREEMPGDEYPYGRAMQDVPGTAQGCWFKEGEDFPPEDRHLALVTHSFFPWENVFSVGTSLGTLQPGIYRFEPEDGGRLNRAFADLGPDGQVYAWTGLSQTPGGWDGTILVQMPDAETLWIEGVEVVLEDPAEWVFSGGQTEYKR